MELSIIILNYKNANLIKYQLQKLVNYKFSFNSEIIVVDNNSKDNIEKIIKTNFPKIKFVKSNKNTGYVNGNNIGVDDAQGKYVLILNPDIRIEKETIEKMMEFVKNNPDAGLVAPRLINADNSIQDTCYRFPDWHYPFYRRTSLSQTKFGKKWLHKFLMKDFDHKSIKKVDWVMGSCYILKKDDVHKHHDPNFFMYLSDMDLCRDLWKNEKTVYYLGNVSALHLHQKASAEKNIFKYLLNKLSWIHLKDYFYYLQKWKKQDLPKSCPSNIHSVK
jgi:N-acetylglucosaminyl-diphospho-decaprenol L-rhamnosyltransferase